jgi:phosphoribosylamine-glycine ligase
VAGTLTEDLVTFSDEAACTVVLAAPGYPGACQAYKSVFIGVKLCG